MELRVMVLPPDAPDVTCAMGGHPIPKRDDGSQIAEFDGERYFCPAPRRCQNLYLEHQVGDDAHLAFDAAEAREERREQMKDMAYTWVARIFLIALLVGFYYLFFGEAKAEERFQPGMHAEITAALACNTPEQVVQYLDLYDGDNEKALPALLKVNEDAGDDTACVVTEVLLLIEVGEAIERVPFDNRMVVVFRYFIFAYVRPGESVVREFWPPHVQYGFIDAKWWGDKAA